VVAVKTGSVPVDVGALKQRVDLLELIGRDTRLKRVASTRAVITPSPCPFCGARDRLRVQPARLRWWCRVAWATSAGRTRLHQMWIRNWRPETAGPSVIEPALIASQEAVAIRRELAAAHPDAFRPNLALSLTNLSNRLSDLGQREDALVDCPGKIDRNEGFR
jgi:hypothetical protein